MKVLIAEDEPVLQELTGKILDMWGYEYDIAVDGWEAVHLAEKNQRIYDLCIIDINMPGMNGYEAAQAIRKKTAYIPIMAMTANPDIKETYRSMGMDDYITKPYPLPRLKTKIQELTVKSEIIYFNEENEISIKKEMPMDAEQLSELRELDKKGLSLMTIEGGVQKFVVHKNIQNKMSHILIGESKELFEFLDRGDNPANCHLYKCNMQTNRVLLSPERFEERLNAEDEDINKYDNFMDQKSSDDKKS